MIVDLQKSLLVFVMLLFILIFAVLLCLFTFFLLILSLNFLLFFVIIFIESINQIIISLFGVSLILDILSLLLTLLFFLGFKFRVLDFFHSSKYSQTEYSDKNKHKNNLEAKGHAKKHSVKSRSSWEVSHQVYTLVCGSKVVHNAHFLYILF